MHPHLPHTETVTYALKHRWKKEIHPDIFPDFGKNNTKKITQLIANLPAGISHTIEPMDQTHVEWFEPMYTKNLASKHNPNPHNVGETTINRPDIKFPYHILTLFENGIPVGGTIFTMRPDRLSMVYRTYAPDWGIPGIKCSPALYAEYLATLHAVEHQKPYLVHGQDNNPYGVNASVGVAIFKLSVGCYPDLPTEHGDVTKPLKDFPDGTLVLARPTTRDTTRITDAYFIGTEEMHAKYEQVFKYEHLLRVHPILLPL